MSREQFEAWAEKERLSLAYGDCGYVYSSTAMAWGAWQAATASMQAERDRLAAECAALKALNEDRRVFIMNGVQLGYIKVPTVETDPALEVIRIAVSPQEQTPATDRFLAEQRAQGVDNCAAVIKQQVWDECEGDGIVAELDAMEIYAAQLRNEVKG